MENKFYNQSKKIKGTSLGLLPNYFKKIGIAIILLAFGIAIVMKAVGIELDQTQKDTSMLLIINLFILGLLFVAWAKDRIEDEMTIALRLKTMGFTFIFAVIYVIGKPFTDLIFNDPIKDLSASGLVLIMLIFYLFLYILQKRGR